MERTKKSLWVKRGGGTLRMPNKIIKPGQKFRALESEIPESFRDLVELLEEEKENKIPELVQKEESTDLPKEDGNPMLNYELRTISNGFYNVYDKNGKAVSDKALRKEPADELYRALTTGDL